VVRPRKLLRTGASFQTGSALIRVRCWSMCSAT
jgi:hypothetical protein